MDIGIWRQTFDSNLSARDRHWFNNVVLKSGLGGSPVLKNQVSQFRDFRDLDASLSEAKNSRKVALKSYESRDFCAHVLK